MLNKLKQEKINSDTSIFRESLEFQRVVFPQAIPIFRLHIKDSFRDRHFACKQFKNKKKKKINNLTIHQFLLIYSVIDKCFNFQFWNKKNLMLIPKLMKIFKYRRNNFYTSNVYHPVLWRNKVEAVVRVPIVAMCLALNFTQIAFWTTFRRLFPSGRWMLMIKKSM